MRWALSGESIRVRALSGEAIRVRVGALSGEASRVRVRALLPYLVGTEIKTEIQRESCVERAVFPYLGRNRETQRAVWRE